jgi:hypothetical protein
MFKFITMTKETDMANAFRGSCEYTHCLVRKEEQENKNV